MNSAAATCWQGADFEQMLKVADETKAGITEKAACRYTPAGR